MRVGMSYFNALFQKVDAILQVERSYKSGLGAVLPPPVDFRYRLPGPSNVRSKMCKDQNCRGGRELAVVVFTFFENSKSAAGETFKGRSRHPATARTP
jgi:hypothetical protein